MLEFLKKLTPSKGSAAVTPEAEVTDPKTAMDFANTLRASGQPGAAALQLLRAAELFAKQGFALKAVAAAKQAAQLQPAHPRAYEVLEAHYAGMNLKEERRATLATLLKLYTAEQRADDVKATRAKLDALGPGR